MKNIVLYLMFVIGGTIGVYYTVLYRKYKESYSKKHFLILCKNDKFLGKIFNYKQLKNFYDIFDRKNKKENIENFDKKK